MVCWWAVAFVLVPCCWSAPASSGNLYGEWMGYCLQPEAALGSIDGDGVCIPNNGTIGFSYYAKYGSAGSGFVSLSYVIWPVNENGFYIGHQTGSATLQPLASQPGFFTVAGSTQCLYFDLTAGLLTENSVLDTYSGAALGTTVCPTFGAPLLCDNHQFNYACYQTPGSTPAPPTPSPQALGLGLGLGLGLPAVLCVFFFLWMCDCLDRDTCCPCCAPKKMTMRDYADAAAGTLETSPLISRRSEVPRDNWMQELEHLGMRYGGSEGIVWDQQDHDTYWNESACYVIHPEGISMLRTAMNELHGMCLTAVDQVCQSDDLLRKFEIPEVLWGAIRTSWQQRQRDVMGRFDLLFNGRDPPKLSEYNADTPTVLVEAAVAQRNWRHSRHLPPTKQFNEIEEALIAHWKRVIKNDKEVITFVSPGGNAIEEQDTVRFLAHTAKKAGYQTEVGDIAMVRYDPDTKRVLYYDRPIATLWKHYPLEWIAEESLSGALQTPEAFAACQWLEPPWKLILGNKALLALLWEMYPNHPNLLPAFYSEAHFKEKNAMTTTPCSKWAAKPRYGRHGWGIVYVKNDQENLDAAFLGTKDACTVKVGTEGHPLSLGHSVFQAFYDTPTLQGRMFVIGGWVVGGRAAGVCVREERPNTIVNDNSCFVPHLIGEQTVQLDKSPAAAVETTNPRIAELRSELYGDKTTDLEKIEFDSYSDDLDEAERQHGAQLSEFRAAHPTPARQVYVVSGVTDYSVFLPTPVSTYQPTGYYGTAVRHESTHFHSTFHGGFHGGS